MLLWHSNVTTVFSGDTVVLCSCVLLHDMVCHPEFWITLNYTCKVTLILQRSFVRDSKAITFEKCKHSLPRVQLEFTHLFC